MRRFVLALIRMYQKTEQALFLYRLPLLVSGGCRSWPTCSQYTHESIEQHGLVRGLAKGFVRILHCNPCTHSS